MTIDSEEQLLEVLTQPSEALIECYRSFDGPLIVLGAGGKMGPTLCVRAKRAIEAASAPVEVIAVSRFSDDTQRSWLESRGVQTIRCDLMDREAIQQLPDTRNVIYLVGMKFGTTSDPALTWAVNALIPSYVCERYAGGRIVALSTGNVYSLVEVASGGSVESDPLSPLGEYANACVARERIFEYGSIQTNAAVVSIRLNYAIDLRYGVLVDLASKIYSGQPVDLTMGYFNCIWQGDANDMILRSLPLAAVPAAPLNLTGPVTYRVKDIALRLGVLINKTVAFTGKEAKTALLNNSKTSHELLGLPSVSIDKMIQWTAHWIQQGNPLLHKPTHFEVRDGQY